MRRLTRCFLAVFCAISFSTRAGELNLDAMTFGDPSSPFFASPGTTPGEKPLLRVRAVPESSQFAPGTPFKLVVELDHLPGAYTYWINPGGPGAGTRIDWNLPEGFAASEPIWPTPLLYRNNSITSYVFRGKTTAVVVVTPPGDVPPGAEISLSATLDTQVCTSRTCTPMKLPFSLSLTARATPGEADPAIAEAEALLPRTLRHWRIEASVHGGELIIAMRPSAGANPDPKEIYYFDEGRGVVRVDSQKPQESERDGDVWRVRAPIAEGAFRQEGKASGILYSANGWLENQAGAAGLAVSVPIGTAEAAVSPAGAYHQTAWLLFFAFLGGLLLNVMPCVFPVIGLKIMGFAKQAHKERQAVFLHGLAYAAGVLLCFWTLAFLVITMGRGWGAQLQSEWFVFILCHVFMILSLNMAGVFEVGSGVAGTAQTLTGREGIKRSFLTGLLATITSTPCSAPFLGTALAYALSLPALLSLGVFTLMGLGFSLPYLALSLFPGWLKMLPKPGPWMETFRQAMCFPLFATTAYMFWTMEGMFEEWRFLMLLFGLVLTAMACWLYGKSQRGSVRSPAGSRALLGAAALSLAGGVWLGFPAGGAGLEWQEWSPEAVALLREEGRPVYVDFTARWCATCQLNKRIYQDSGLMELIADKNVALLKADWTLYDERITSTLRNEFNKAAVPVTVLYAPNRNRADILPEILTVGAVAELLNGLP